MKAFMQFRTLLLYVERLAQGTALFLHFSLK
jgi:hypothetical protein